MISKFAASIDNSAFILISNRKIQKMIPRTFYAIQATALISFFAITSPASAQSYHHPIRHIAKYSAVVDSVNESAHLQLSVVQQEKAGLKFRVTVLNPAGRNMSINILRNDDVLFSDNASGDQYFNLFNLDQLEDGEYKVVVFNGKERVVKNIRLQTATTVDRQISIN
jgi:hypothetical protein